LNPSLKIFGRYQFNLPFIDLPSTPFGDVEPERFCLAFWQVV